MNISTIGIIGAGQMGQGIAQIFAMAGFRVILNDIDSAVVERGIQAISNNLERLQKKHPLPATHEAIMDRISGSNQLTDMASVELVIEAIIENEELKQSLFRQLDKVCPAQTVLASNTSSISITRIAAVTDRPDRVIGIHFMNPVPVMKLVEVIRGLKTSESTYQATIELITRLEKEAITSQDRPGFIVNRILIPMINEAIFALDEGIGNAEEIDRAMKLGAAHPLGPLALADLIGLDTCLSIMQVLYEGYNDSKYRPCPLLKQMVDGGYTGRKAGRGFFEYN